MIQMKLGMKLLVTGLLTMTVPIIVIGVVSVHESSRNITVMSNSDLSHTAGSLAAALNIAVEEQIVTVRNIALANSSTAAAEKVAREGLKGASSETLLIQRYLTRMKKADQRVDTLALLGKDGGVIASSEDGKFNGANLSGPQYIQNALRGTANAGSVLASRLTGTVVIAAGAPVHDLQGKEILGAVVMGIDLKLISDIMGKIRIGKSGYAYLINEGGLHIFHPDKEQILKVNINQVKGMETVAQLVGPGKDGIAEYLSAEGTKKECAVAHVPTPGWSVVTTVPTEELYAPAYRTRDVIIVIALISLTLASIVYFFFARTFTRPVNSLVDAAERIAVGDVNIKATAEDRGDEIGALSRAFTAMVGSLQEKTVIARRISSGDLTIADISPSDTDVLGVAFSSMIETLRRQIQEIVEGVGVLASSGSEIMTTISQLSASVAETSAAVNETTTTAEEVKQTTDLNAQKAQHVSELGRRSVEISEKGQRSLDDAIQGMDRINVQMEAISDMVIRLSEQSQTIGEIVDTVSDLAEQSNLLAVNASIEAAKAGEQGKGFGVVAQEIRSLASGSKQATGQIRKILFDVQKAISSVVMATEQGSKAVEEGARLSRQAVEAINVLAHSVAQATDAAVQIAASSQEQLLGTDQVVAAMESIREASLQMSSGTRQTEKAVHDLQNVSLRLQDIVKFYKV